MIFPPHVMMRSGHQYSVVVPSSITELTNHSLELVKSTILQLVSITSPADCFKLSVFKTIMPSLNSSSLAIHDWLLHSACKASDQGSPQDFNHDTKALNSAGSTQQQPTCRGFPGLDGDLSEEVIPGTFSMARQEPCES